MPANGLVVIPQVARDAAGVLPALSRIANRPIACHALESLAAAGLSELALVAAPAVIDQVRAVVEDELALAAEVAYLPQDAGEGLPGALRSAAPFVGDSPALVHLGDGLLGQPLERLPMAPTDGAALLLVLHRSDDPREGLGPAAQRLLGLAELDGSRTRLAATGVCAFGPGVLRQAAELAFEAEPEAGPVELAQQLAAAGARPEVAIVRGWRRYRGDPMELLELNRIALDRQPAEGELIDPGSNRIEGVVIIHPTADVQSSRLLGPCIIGAGARVSSSYIGPHTSVGAGAELEGVEILRSIVSEGARIRHVGGRIEESTIGRRASIFRDFGLPRAMRLHVGEDVQVALQ